MKNRKKGFLNFTLFDQIDKVTAGRQFHKIEEHDWKDILLPGKKFSGRVLESTNWYTTCFLIILGLMFFLLFLRLFHLQIINGDKNRELAEGNRIQVKLIHAQRGVIFDRNGKILAANSPAFRLVQENKRAEIITREEALEWEVKNDPRVNNLEIDGIRTYPLAQQFAHIIGYVGEVSQQQLERFKVKLGDRIGQSGIESTYESILKGVDGGEIIEVDAQGKKLRTLRKVAATSGKDIYLTIDADLQHQSYQLLTDALQKSGSCCGVVVVEDPKTGQILASVSLPSYDNNIFTNSAKSDQITEVLSDSTSPILNRVVGGTYPPGSTFKIITSIAALSTNKFEPNATILDTGEIYIGTFRFTNWYFTQYGRTEGAIDLVGALKRSNDTYFYRVGQAIGEKMIIDWARKLNLGSKLGIDTTGEVDGLIGDSNWKIKNTNQPWYPGDTLHLAIGQGFVVTTPLQILALSSFIAADGELLKPQLMLKITKGDQVVENFKPQIIVANIIAADKIKLIKQGLREVTKAGGTAWPFFNFPISSAGKTGTAEYGDPEGKTHAWYTAFAPINDPKIAITVLIEGGGEGSSVSAPLAKEVMRWYFSQDKNNLIKDSYQSASDSAKALGE